MSDFELTDMTGAEDFWYILMCIAFEAGNFVRIPTGQSAVGATTVSGSTTGRVRHAVTGPSQPSSPAALSSERHRQVETVNLATAIGHRCFSRDDGGKPRYL
jgi:hypothetical protein